MKPVFQTPAVTNLMLPSAAPLLTGGATLGSSTCLIWQMYFFFLTPHAFPDATQKGFVSSPGIVEGLFTRWVNV